MASIQSMLGIAAMLTVFALAGCVSPEPNVPGDGDGAGVGPETYTITVEEPPTTVTANESFTFNITIEGDVESTTDHAGAHYGNQSSDEPSTTVYDQTCAHSGGAVPGSFEVTCTISEPGTYYYRGHLRITEGGQTHNWWSEEHQVVVA